MREMAKQGRLRCPSCKEKLWFKCGNTNRPHFAHRRAAKCPLNSKKAAEELEAQALLYELLEAQGEMTVAVDVLFEGEAHAVDILLGSKGNYQRAFYFLSKDRRNLAELLATAKSRDIPTQIIYTESKYQPDRHLLKLTKQQRGNTQHSRRYDPYESPNLGHLYFIDTKNANFHIYRGLRPYGKCRLYYSDSQQSVPVSELNVDDHGEIFTAEDDSNRKSPKLEGAAPTPLTHGPEFSDETDGAIYPWEDDEEGPDSEIQPTVDVSSESWQENTVSKGLASLSKAYKCEDCGIVTSEWSSAAPNRGTCVCNKCIAKRHKEGKDDYDW